MVMRSGLLEFEFPAYVAPRSGEVQFYFPAAPAPERSGEVQFQFSSRHGSDLSGRVDFLFPAGHFGPDIGGPLLDFVASILSGPDSWRPNPRWQ